MEHRPGWNFPILKFNESVKLTSPDHVNSKEWILKWEFWIIFAELHQNAQIKIYWKRENNW